MPPSRLILVLGLLLLSTQIASAQSSGIRSCYGKTSGQIRIIGASESCKSSETLLILNEGGTGQKGDKGDVGPAGPAGPQGPPGPAGSGGVTMTALCDTVFSAITDERARTLNCASFFGSAKVVFLAGPYSGGLAESLAAGDQAGLLGADAKCQREAMAANLPGTYKAWLSSPSTAARDRLTHAIVPYVQTDLTVVAANWNQFASANHSSGITKDALGHVVAPVPGLGIVAWTGSTETGDIAPTSFSSFCDSWKTNAVGATGPYGTPAVSGADPKWSLAGELRCDAAVFRLICVAQ